MDNIYTQQLIDHYTTPRNFKILPGYTHYSDSINAACGDELYIYAIIKNDRIVELSFQGSGCAICIGMMSILTEELKDMHMSKVRELTDEMILSKLNMGIDHSRRECALLPIRGIKKLIK